MNSHRKSSRGNPPASTSSPTAGLPPLPYPPASYPSYNFNPIPLGHVMQIQQPFDHIPQHAPPANTALSAYPTGPTSFTPIGPGSRPVFSSAHNSEMSTITWGSSPDVALEERTTAFSTSSNMSVSLSIGPSAVEMAPTTEIRPTGGQELDSQSMAKCELAIQSGHGSLSKPLWVTLARESRQVPIPSNGIEAAIPSHQYVGQGREENDEQRLSRLTSLRSFSRNLMTRRAP